MIKVLSLFDGMRCGRLALQRAGIPVNKYYASEVDKYAIQVATANWPDDVNLGDVTKWREWDIDWSTIDLLIGGSPCQGFSAAGKQGGTKATIHGQTVVVTTREMYVALKAGGPSSKASRTCSGSTCCVLTTQGRTTRALSSY